MYLPNYSFYSRKVEYNLYSMYLYDYLRFQKNYQFNVLTIRIFELMKIYHINTQFLKCCYKRFSKFLAYFIDS